ncbi:MAG: hypothetical protein PHF60_01300 [Candidatus ainarchaeum sp.]|nr:hypothetical protein [Candidatus ainarchaeum sp.]
MAKEQKYGEWAFLGGLILALLVGVASGFIGATMLPVVMAVLAILGLVVGFLNISEKEVNAFLIATIALLMAFNSLGPITSVIQNAMGDTGIMLVAWLSGFMGAVVAFISPAAFIVALKAIYNLARSD